MITSYKSTYHPTIDGVPIGVVAQAFATYPPISPANYAWSEVMGSQSSRFITYIDMNDNVYYSLGVRGQLTPINITGGLGAGAFTQIGVLGDIFYGTDNYAESQNFHVRNLANGKYISGSDFTLVGDNTTALVVPVVWSNSLAISQNGFTSIDSEGVSNCQPGSTLASDGTDLIMISNGLGVNNGVNGGLYFVILKNKQAILSGVLDGEAGFGVSNQGGFLFSSQTEYCFNVNQNWPNDGGLTAINMTKNGDFLNQFDLDISEDIFNLPGGIYLLDNQSIQAGVNYLHISGFSIIPEKVFGILLPFGNGPVAKTLFLSLNSNWETIGQIVIDDAINSTHVMEDGRLLLLGLLGSYQVDVYAVNITPSSALTNYGFVLPSDSNLQPYMFSDIREIFGGTIPKAAAQNRKKFLGQLL